MGPRSQRHGDDVIEPGTRTERHGAYYEERDEHRDRRRVMRKALISALSRLAPGATHEVTLPVSVVAAREAYTAVNGVAFRVFGKGNYQVRRNGDVVAVTRMAAVMTAGGNNR
jgi:hypothetical protein